MRSVPGFLVLVLSVESAHAGPSAEQLYDDGQREYDAGHYAEAIERWQASYDASHLPLLVFNIAQAYRLAGECTKALTAYRRYIVLDPTTEQLRAAEGFVAELEPKCGAPSPPPAVAISRELATPRSNLKLAGLVTGGAGVALLITGLVIGKHASTLGDRVTTACSTSCDWAAEQSTDAAGRRDATIGYSLDALGVAGIVGGVVMLYLDRSDAVMVSPRAGDGGAVLSWSGSW